MRVGSAASPGRRLSPPWPSLPDDEHLLIMNSGQTVSVYRFGFFYGQGRGGGRRGCLSDGWSMLKYIGVWVCGRLAVGGGSSAFSSCNLVPTSCCGPVCRRRSGKACRTRRYWLCLRVGRQSSRAQGRSGRMKSYSYPICPLYLTAGGMTQGYNCIRNTTIYLVGPATTYAYA